MEKEIEELAMLQFSNAEIAQIAELTKEQLITNYSESITKGRLLAEAEVRRAVLKSAKEGNTTAQKNFMAMNKKAKAGR